MGKCNFQNAEPPSAETPCSMFYSLQTTCPNSQFIHQRVIFESGQTHSFIVDTGSSESIIPNGVLQKVCPAAVVKVTNIQIRGVTGHRLQLLGETTLKVHVENRRLVPIRFLVSESSPAILGLQAMKSLDRSVCFQTTAAASQKLSELQKLASQCSNCTGGMKVQPAVLEVSGEPVFMKRRLIPYGQREGVQKAIAKMEHDGILTRVNSSAWATPIVVAIKSDGRTPRICGDYRLTLNPRLRRCAATTMEPEDFMKALSGSKCFSKIDLANAYLQIPLSETSKQFTTINTPWGLYQYNFLPFGLHVSSGIFQSAIDHVLKGIYGVLAYQDDVIIFGRSKEEHDHRLRRLLHRFVEHNVAIKPSKCVFGESELEFLGFTVSASGYRPDSARLTPLVEMDSPKDQSQLRSIMGCLQYYSRFIPNFTTKA